MCRAHKRRQLGGRTLGVIVHDHMVELGLSLHLAAGDPQPVLDLCV
jgi:hypothetical protein